MEEKSELFAIGFVIEMASFQTARMKTKKNTNSVGLVDSVENKLLGTKRCDSGN